MKDALCRAFCGDLRLTDVPAGYAVSTTFLRGDGDSIGFYIVRDDVYPHRYRLEDDGTTITSLEAAGVEFSTETRAQAFAELLETYDAEFDEAEMLLHSRTLSEKELPSAAMKFVALMLRMNDFVLLTRDKVASTFKEDATRMIKERVGDRAVVSENAPVSVALRDNVPDLLLQAPDRRPVAVFLGTSQQRVYEAILLQMQALYEAREDVAVIALLENDRILSREVLRKASNRLEALPNFRGDEIEAVHRVTREVLGPPQATLH